MVAKPGVAGSLANSRISHCNDAQRVGEICEVGFTTVRMRRLRRGGVGMTGKIRTIMPWTPEPGRGSRSSLCHIGKTAEIVKQTKRPTWCRESWCPDDRMVGKGRHHILGPCTNKENNLSPQKTCLTGDNIVASNTIIQNFWCIGLLRLSTRTLCVLECLGCCLCVFERSMLNLDRGAPINPVTNLDASTATDRDATPTLPLSSRLNLRGPQELFTPWPSLTSISSPFYTGSLAAMQAFSLTPRTLPPCLPQLPPVPVFYPTISTTLPH